MPWILITSVKEASHTKKLLEGRGLYDKKRKIEKLADGEVSIPIKTEQVTFGADEGEHLSNYQSSRIEFIEEGKISEKQKLPPCEKLKDNVRSLISKYNIESAASFLAEFPSCWETHGDLVLLPEQSFNSKFWDQFGVELWSVTAASLGAKRVAKKSVISNDGYRTPNVTLLLGDNGNILHVDNKIKYSYDITKCMFSSGNVTEKIRIGKLDCSGETVVDLYAGIGYFVLPYLVHGKAELVYACEWNKHAVEALRENAQLNGVEDRCIIHEGDNREFPFRGIADRVNLGIIPSSEAGWAVACAALKPDKGGWLHVHGNVSSGLKSDAQGKKSKTAYDTEEDVKMLECDQGNYEDTVLTQCEQNKLKTKGAGEIKTSSIGGDDTVGTRRCTVKIPSCNKSIRNEWVDWAEFVTNSLKSLLCDAHCASGVNDWVVSVGHLERVKSYAPHISHLVLDVECRPIIE